MNHLGVTGSPCAANMADYLTKNPTFTPTYGQQQDAIAMCDAEGSKVTQFAALRYLDAIREAQNGGISFQAQAPYWWTAAAFAGGGLIGWWMGKGSKRRR